MKAHEAQIRSASKPGNRLACLQLALSLPCCSNPPRAGACPLSYHQPGAGIHASGTRHGRSVRSQQPSAHHWLAALLSVLEQVQTGCWKPGCTRSHSSTPAGKQVHACCLALNLVMQESQAQAKEYKDSAPAPTAAQATKQWGRCLSHQ
jgi:hypothetical protein